MACQAAYLAACLPQKFSQVEKDIFDNQEGLSQAWLEDYAKKENVSDCYQSPETKNKVTEYIGLATPFNIRSTPTLILNGVKIEGVLPYGQLKVLLDHLVNRADN